MYRNVDNFIIEVLYFMPQTLMGEIAPGRLCCIVTASNGTTTYSLLTFPVYEFSDKTFLSVQCYAWTQLCIYLCVCVCVFVSVCVRHTLCQLAYR